MKNPLEATEYARLTGFDGKWRETWWRQDFVKFFLERHGIAGAHAVLDVGCGAGHWGRTLAAALADEAEISGIDIEAPFVDRAAELGRAAGLTRLDYRVGDAEQIPYPDDRFDLVTCQTVMIHVRHPERALAEMRRVLKPGGAVLLAEPNNLTGYFNSLLTEPRPEWPVTMRLVDFYHRCLEGKKELGHGDSAIGERLPCLAARAGFHSVQVALNENCPALIPPYETGTQPTEVEAVKSYLGKEIWSGFGPRHNALRFFRAAGGEEREFDELWSLAMATQKQALIALQNGAYHGGRGGLMYLVVGRK